MLCVPQSWVAVCLYAKCSFASHAQPVPLSLPPVTPPPLLPAIHLLHPCMGPQCWLPSLPVSPPNTTATTPTPTQAEGLALPYIAVSAAGWRLEEPSGLQTVSGLETALWSTPTATWEEIIKLLLPRDWCDWCCQYVKVWNKLALWYDPKWGCLCRKKRQLKVKSAEDGKCFLQPMMMTFLYS